MFKSIVAATAVFASALFAHGANVSSVTKQMGTLDGSASPYTAASLVYKTADDASSDCNRSVEGWYAGLKLSWTKNKQKTSDTNVSASDNADSINEISYKASDYTSDNRAPANSGMKNTTTTSWFTPYMETTEWYVCITPEILYSLGETDYSATLTIGGNTYTITVPQTVELFDGDGVQWYPAKAVVDGKVYGDMGLAVEAGATAAAAGKDMAFFEEPTGCPEGVSVEKDGNVWKLVVSGPTSIESVDITLSKTEPITFDGKEHSVDVTAVMLGDVVLSSDVDYSVSGDLSATERGEYTVTVTGINNFEGTATATWSIVNTTGTGSTVTESATGSMTASGNDFTLSDSSKLEYDAENAVWYAGIKITWPVETKDSWAAGGGGYAHYVKMDSVQVTVSDGSVSHATQSDKFRQSLTSGEKAFSYLSTTTWKVPLTPTIISEALAEEKTELVYTMTAGAFIWGNDTEGDPDGVAFQDYTITIPLNENLTLCDNYGNQVYPAVDYVAQIDGKKYLSLAAALEASASGQTVALIAQDDYVGEYEIPEGVTAELGAFGSADATYVLSIGSVLTSDAECTVSTSETGYGVELSGEGPYTYNVVLQHVHNWEVVVNGSELTATCNAEACPLDVTTYSMRLFTGVKSGATEDVDGKVYDGESMSRKAEFGVGFTNVFPNVSTQFSVTKGGESVNTIKDAGEYVVTMTVTGVGNDETVEYTLVKEVAISQLDIEGATVTLNPSSVTYDGKEHTVSCTIKKNNLTATFDFAEGSVTSATAIGEYTVTMDATGNFTGSATAEWSIVNTTGSLSGVTSAVSGIGDYDSENNTLTVTDSTALEYSDGAWYAGLTLTWPMTALNVSLNPLRDGSADYVKPEKMQLTIDGNVYTGSEILSSEAVYSAGKLAAKVSTDTYKYYESLISQPTKQFEYLATTTWKVAVTPAIIEAALANDEDELVYTMNAGAFVWEDGREGDSDGVAFADYTITLPLDEPVEFVLGEGEAYDLGDTELTTTKIQLAAGASVTSSVEQTVADAIYTTETGYDVVCTEDGGKYVYTAKITHVHDWTYSVDGATLTATCGAAECTVEGNATTVSLNLSSGDKNYDNTAIAVSAVFDGSFKTVFPDAEATISTTKDGEPIDNDKIKDAGAYVVTMTVTGLSGGQSRDVSRNVTISKVDISEAALVLSPATTPYNGTEQAVTPSVTVGGVTATLNDGLVVVEGSTCSATDIDTYSVTVEGTGNFTGTASATWSIVNTTGEPTSVTESAAGSMTKNGNDFTLSDSSKLEYDSENKAWYAGITISWPVETKDWQALSQNSHAYYVTEDCVRITKDVGEVVHTPGKGSYITGYNWLQPINSEFDYLARTTWTVELTPAIIEAAFAEEKTVLEYTLRAGAIPSDTYAQGVAFRDYTITIPLEGIKLYDGDGKQVYPKAEGQTIIEDIKDDIGDVVSDAEVAESAKAKIDLLAGVAGEGKEQSVAEWVDSMKGDDAATFYAELAKSEYVEASFGLGTTSLISDASDVEVAEFESTGGGFTLAVTIDEKNIDAERIQQLASIIWSATSLGGESKFAPLVPGRISVEGGKVIVSKDANADCEFFKIMISKDSAE